MKNYDVFYFIGDEKAQMRIEGKNLFDLHTVLEKILYQSELDSVYRVEEVYKHNDEQYANDTVDEVILNSFVGAPS